MKLKVLRGIAGVQAIMLLASVALTAYPKQEVRRGNTTTWLINVRETLDAKVVSGHVD